VAGRLDAALIVVPADEGDRLGTDERAAIADVSRTIALSYYASRTRMDPKTKPPP